MHLDGGKAVTWVVQVYNTTRSPVRHSAVLAWEPNGGSSLSDLSVASYRLGNYGDNDSDLDFAAKKW
jgi:hypothetical protein